MNRVVQLRYSPDGGRNWSPWRDYDMGSTGDFDPRAVFRRLGISRAFLVEFKDTSPYRGDVIGASIDIG